MKRITVFLALIAGVSAIGCQQNQPRWIGQHNSPAFRTHMADGQPDPSQNPFLQSPGAQPGMNGANSGRVHLADHNRQMMMPNQQMMPGAQTGGATTIVHTGYPPNGQPYPQQQPQYSENPFAAPGNGMSQNWQPHENRGVEPAGPWTNAH